MARVAAGGLMLLATLCAVPAGWGAEIQLFEGRDFQGRRFEAHDNVRNLDRTDFNDRASSILVRSGVWDACADADFQGGCVQLEPGEYRDLDRRIDRRISSLRLVRDTRPGDDRRVDAPPPPIHSGGEARAILYEGPDFHGRSFPIDRDTVRNLDRAGFNDRAQSLRVEGGYWIFCSDANFEGDCRTFGPGDYAELPGDLNRRISSGRRVADRYPYREQPVWDRH